jgi:two-component system chemotaxis response regulator CheB
MSTSVQRHGVVVIGGSAGALPQVEAIMVALPTLLAIPVIVVLHRGPDTGTSEVLARRLARRSALGVEEIEDPTAYSPTVVHVAPPGYHTLIDVEGPVLSSEPRQSYSIPSIDAAFDSAADTFGAGVVGVVLSSANEDGVQGARHILDSGGVVLSVRPEACPHPVLVRAVSALPGVEVRDLADLAVRVRRLAS